MRYKESFVKDVLAKTNIVDIIGHYTKLTEKDGLYYGNCPMHEDKKQSMVIYPDKQVYHCFDCGSGGNAVTFLMKQHGVTMDVAIEKLAKRAGIALDKAQEAQKSNDVLKQNLYNINKDAAMFFKRKLNSKEGVEAKEYFKGKREYTDELIENIHCGYSPTKGNALYKYLLQKGYPEELMVQAGLVRISENGPYDMFRGRVMFPIMDEQKRFIAFGGRVMDDSKPKYLNSPETAIFDKSKTLFGVHYLKQLADEKKKKEIKTPQNKKQQQAQKPPLGAVVLCEGYADAAALIKNNIPAVAVLGTALTPSHLPELQKYTNNLLLAFDSDAAGKKAAMRAIKALDGSEMNAKVMSLSPYKDPDEFIKALGKEEFMERARRAIDITDFQLQYLAEQYDMNDPEQKQAYLTKAVELMIKGQERSLERAGAGEAHEIDRD